LDRCLTSEIITLYYMHKEKLIDMPRGTHVEGKNIGHIVAYTLSTCVWCKKMKRLLNELGIEYDYIDVDLLEGDEKEQARKEVLRWNHAGSFPTIVIDNKKSINGYEPEKVKELLDS